MKLLLNLMLSLSFAACAFAADPTTTRPAPEKINPDLPTLWLIGDSTVHNGRGDGSNGQWGWGEPLVSMFDTSKINVVNRALGGTSSRTFITQGRWDAVLKQIKKGDYVIMQFGHNDGSALSGDNRERGTIRGTGDESKEVTLTLGDNKDKKETVHTYGWYIGKYIDDARAKGATAIVCSPIPRLPRVKVTGPTSKPSGYDLWAQEIAEQKKALFIPLNHLILKRYEGMEPSEIHQKYFADPNTHTNWDGAKLNAEAVVEGIKNLKDCPLATYLK